MERMNGYFLDGEEDEDGDVILGQPPAFPRRMHLSQIVWEYLSGVPWKRAEGREKRRRIAADAERKNLTRLDSGEYLAMDRPASIVRSTIALAFSHDGRRFASTHGDHTVKVFAYPSGKHLVSLEGHPRTPWTVQFHPTDSNILASGCRGNECLIWSVADGKIIARHRFEVAVSGISFHPRGDLVAIASRTYLHIWRFRDWKEDDCTKGGPYVVMEASNGLNLAQFNPTGDLIMTGERNRYLIPAGQFSVKVTIHRFDCFASGRRHLGPPIFVAPRVIAYNDAGVHFSPCGRMMAACIPMPRGEDRPFHIAILSMDQNCNAPIGAILRSTPLGDNEVGALTNLRFSSSSSHLLAAFSFRNDNVMIGPQGARVVSIFDVHDMHFMNALYCDVDETGVEDAINVAAFCPGFGSSDGIVYGTQNGRVKLFRPLSYSAGQEEETVEKMNGLDLSPTSIPRSFLDSSELWPLHMYGSLSRANSF